MQSDVDSKGVSLLHWHAGVEVEEKLKDTSKDLVESKPRII